MHSRHFKETLRRRRWIVLAVAAMLVGGLLVAIPSLASAAGEKRTEYTFLFGHTDGTTTRITGTATVNDTFIANAGGTSATDPTGMIVHVSCSDPFTDGWGVKQGPDPVADSEWRVLSYYLVKYEGEQIKKTCGTPEPPGPPPRPAIDIEKATNGEDADLPTGPQVRVGSTVTWTFVVTNTGNTALSGVAVVDDKEGAISCPKNQLAVGESMTCTKQGTAQLGQYANVAEVTGVGPSVAPPIPADKGMTYTFLFEHRDGSTSTVSGTATSNDTFIADAGGASATDPTGMIVHVSCSDPFTGGWGVKQGPDPAADPEWRILSYYIVKYDKGVVKTTCGTPIPSTQTVRDSDPSHYIGVAGNPGIDIEKATNGEDADLPPGPRLRVGDPVTWTYVVTNTGALDLYNISVSDDKEGPIGTIAFLAVGASQTLTHTGIALAGLPGGQYANLGCVVGYTLNGVKVEDCDPSHYDPPGDYPEPPTTVAVDLEKATNGEDADQPTGPRVLVGSTVTWTYVIRNTGQQALWGIYLYDEEEGRIACPYRSLQPGQTMTCRATGTAVAGQYANEAWVDAWGDNGTRVSDLDWSHYYGYRGGDYPGDYPQPAPAVAVDLEKATNGQDADQPTGPRVLVGSTVTWTYVIRNTGQQALWGIYLYDEGRGRIDCPYRSLQPGQTMTCRATGTAVAGQYAREAWVNAWGDDGTRASDLDWSHYYGYRAT